MVAKAVYRHYRCSPQKAREVVAMIRGKDIDQALDVLSFSNKKAAKGVKKVLESAIANAEHNHKMDVENLTIAQIFVDEGVTLKRYRARAKGRGNRILKRSCHVTVVLSDH